MLYSFFVPSTCLIFSLRILLSPANCFRNSIDDAVRSIFWLAIGVVFVHAADGRAVRGRKADLLPPWRGLSCRGAAVFFDKVVFQNCFRRVGNLLRYRLS